MRRRGFEVIEVHASRGTPLRRAMSVLRRLHRSAPFDAIVVTYPAYGVGLPIALYGRRHARVVIDGYISLYDTWADDEQRSAPRRVLAFVMEWLLVRVADVFVLDTEWSAEALRRRTRCDPTKVVVFPVISSVTFAVPVAVDGVPAGGLPERRQRWSAAAPSTPRPVPALIWYGNLQPLSGLPVLAEGVALAMARRPFRLTAACDRSDALDVLLAHGVPFDAIDFLGFQPIDVLLEVMADSDIALGIFGASPKVDRVVPNKVADALSVGVPVVTADTPPIRSLPTGTALLAVERTPTAIARALLDVAEDDVATRARRRADAFAASACFGTAAADRSLRRFL